VVVSMQVAWRLNYSHIQKGAGLDLGFTIMLSYDAPPFPSSQFEELKNWPMCPGEE
jgi:hypothetical protein